MNKGVSRFLGGSWKQWITMYNRVHHMALYKPESSRYILYNLIQSRDLFQEKTIPRNINYMLESAKEDYEVKALTQKIINKLDNNEIASFLKVYNHEIGFNQYTSVTYPEKQNLTDLLYTKEAKDTYSDMIKIIENEHKDNINNKYSKTWNNYYNLFNSNESRDIFKIFMRLHRLNNSWIDVGSQSMRNEIGTFDMMSDGKIVRFKTNNSS